MSKDFRHNTFRAADAFEYADAYRTAVLQDEATIRDRLTALHTRIGPMVDIPSYLLAALRGYEDALLFVTDLIVPTIVKLDDTDAPI